jgi:hypothetical protein
VVNDKLFIVEGHFVSRYLGLYRGVQEKFKVNQTLFLDGASVQQKHAIRVIHLDP